MDKQQLNVAIGKNIRALRLAEGLSQQDLADMLQPATTQQYVYRLEAGSLGLTPQKAVCISKVLGVSIDTLYSVSQDDSNAIFNDSQVRTIVAAYKTLDDDRRKKAVCEVIKVVVGALSDG